MSPPPPLGHRPEDINMAFQLQLHCNQKEKMFCPPPPPGDCSWAFAEPLPQWVTRIFLALPAPKDPGHFRTPWINRGVPWNAPQLLGRALECPGPNGAHSGTPRIFGSFPVHALQAQFNSTVTNSSIAHRLQLQLCSPSLPWCIDHDRHNT